MEDDGKKAIAVGKRKLGSEWLRTLPIRVRDECPPTGTTGPQCAKSVFDDDDDDDDDGGEGGDDKKDVKTEGRGGKGEVEMVVHPAILGKRSKFFQALDAAGESAEVEFVVPGGMRSFSTLIEFLYSGVLIEPLSEHTCATLYYLAHKYDVDALLDLCEEWWRTHCFPKPPLKLSIKLLSTLLPNEQKLLDLGRPIHRPHSTTTTTHTTHKTSAAAAGAITLGVGQAGSGVGGGLGRGGGVAWRRVNGRLMVFLGTIEAQPSVKRLFAHVIRVDNSVREEMGLSASTDVQMSILDSAYLHLALQIWSECHRGATSTMLDESDYHPLIVHHTDDDEDDDAPQEGADGVYDQGQGRTFAGLMGEILGFLSPHLGVQLLRPLKQVEQHKLTSDMSTGTGTATTSVNATVYQMGRLAPMSQGAMNYIAKCQTGQEMNRRFYPLVAVPSVVQSAAAAILTKLLSTETDYGSNNNNSNNSNNSSGSGSSSGGSGGRRRLANWEGFGAIVGYLGPKIRVSVALELLCRAASAMVDATGTESAAGAEEDGPRALLMRVAVLMAFCAGQLLVRWDNSVNDIFDDLAAFLDRSATALGFWNQTTLSIFLAGLALAANPKNTFESLATRHPYDTTATAPTPPTAQSTASTPITPATQSTDATATAAETRSAVATTVGVVGATDLDLVDSGRYERVCVLCLAGLSKRFMTDRTADQTAMVGTLGFLCGAIEFRRFNSHDASWSLLLGFYNQLKDEKAPHLQAAVDRIVAALNQHVKLPLLALKQCPWDDLRLKILTSEDRERFLLTRHQRGGAGGAGGSSGGGDDEDVWFVGKVIDVSDREYWRGRWCPCEVLACRHEKDDSTTVYIKYIGWSAYYNRWINSKIDAARIAPLGKHTTERALYGVERPPPKNPNAPTIAIPLPPPLPPANQPAPPLLPPLPPLPALPAAAQPPMHLPLAAMIAPPPAANEQAR